MDQVWFVAALWLLLALIADFWPAPNSTPMSFELNGRNLPVSA